MLLKLTLQCPKTLREVLKRLVSRSSLVIPTYHLFQRQAGNFLRWCLRFNITGSHISLKLVKLRLNRINRCFHWSHFFTHDRALHFYPAWCRTLRWKHCWCTPCSLSTAI